MPMLVSPALHLRHFIKLYMKTNYTGEKSSFSLSVEVLGKNNIQRPKAEDNFVQHKGYGTM